jgi:hypothetical protein
MHSSPNFHRRMACTRHTAAVMEDEGSSSNCGEQAALPEATEAIATSSTSTSSSDSGKISGLDWSSFARVAVPHPPLVAIKVKVRVIGVMSK